MDLRWLCAVLLVLPGAWGDCPQPPRFAFAEPSTPTLDSYPVGTQLRYRCRPGYTLAGSKFPIITCLPNSSWSENPDFCIGKPCGPPDIMNGKFHFTTDLLFGSTITFTCDVGYRLVGKSSAECVLTDTGVSWDNIPYCESIPCLPPPAIENGQLLNGNRDFTFGMSATYRCNSGFSLIGDDTIHCTADENLVGVWSGTAPECKGQECTRPVIENGNVSPDSFHFETVVTFSCHAGYELKGSSRAECVASGSGVSWDRAFPRCEKKQTVSFCEDPPTISNGMHNGTKGETFVSGSVVVYKCKDGFTLTGDALLECVADEHQQGWSKPAPECRDGANIIIVGILPLLLAILVMYI
ncbi:complement component receptor 1-like protein [Aegotheles albertisi]